MKQDEMKEKNNKRVPKTNVKSQNLALPQKPHQWDNHQGSTKCTLLKLDEGITQI